MMRFACILCVILIIPSMSDAQSFRFLESQPGHYDFLDIPVIPEGFGDGEFTFEIWIKPDAQFPVGPIWRAAQNQLVNWSELDPSPYSSETWWLTGNWLLDGHTRPAGFSPGDNREGTFSLQFYGGGRVRWMFADGDAKQMPKGGVRAIQAYPAATSPSLLDGKWHKIVCVRRWTNEGAQLELWIDGVLIDSASTPLRTNMRQYWDHPSHPDDPKELGGWALGAEVMTAWNFAFTQYEDYKGWIDDIKFWGRAKSHAELSAYQQPDQTKRLLAHFDFSPQRHRNIFYDTQNRYFLHGVNIRFDQHVPDDAPQPMAATP